MKKLLLLGFILFIVSKLQAQLTISTTKPKAGEVVLFSYNPTDGPLAKATTIKAESISFDSKSKTLPPSVPIVLQKEGHLWKGAFEVKKTNMVGVLLTFKDDEGKIIDNNKDNGYGILIYDTNGQPLKGAKAAYANAMSSANRHASFRLRPNASTIVELYEGEFGTNPDIKKEWIFNYLMALVSAKTEGYKEKLNKELDEEIKLRPEADLVKSSFYVNIYRHIGEKEKAEKYAQLIREKDPKGMFVQQEQLTKLVEEKDPTKKAALFENFQAEFPSSMLVTNAAQVTLKAFVEERDAAGLKAFIEKYENKFQGNKPNLYNSIAWQMAEKNMDFTIAEEFSRKSIETAKAEKAPASTIQMFKDTYGFIMEKQGKMEEAYQNYKEAIGDNVEQSNTEINERYVLAAIKTNRLDEAKTAAEAYTKADKSTDKIRDALKEIYGKTLTATETEAYISNLERDAKTKEYTRIRSNMISEPAPAFTLKDLHGNTVSLASLKGKTVILDFWATWCGPCIASFPGMQKARQKYASDSTVKFLFVNTWERTDEVLTKVKEFVASKKYNDFIVPLDLDNKVVNAYKVDGIPTKFVVDGNGNIRFKSVGYSGSNSKLLEELSAMIEITKGNTTR